MPASIFGVLARLGLLALTSYDGEAIFPLVYVQALGCFIMGAGLGLKEPIGNFYGPLYTAWTTGFCGSLTTFSSWQLDIFNSWINAERAHRGGLRDAIDGLAKTVFTLVIALASLSFGAQLSSQLRPYLPSLRPPVKAVRYGLTVVAILMYAATIPVYFRLSHKYRHEVTAALLFSFPGTLTRYVLSIKLNPLLKTLPLGTYTANMFGTALIGAFHVLQSTSNPPSPNACGLLQGLADGYCGCLTTVSTFAAEVGTLREKKAWFYAVTSWLTGQLLLLVILGSSYWAGGVKEQITCKFA
ncbi:hypothetical protein PLICRDRAFT_99062 [Plicaturopsis crispa FD-325 SS-3]|nr:hypothetical protein PLICRDRAFT_99062 [Plicaturopsis crispa FD-325 SS-3]